MKPSSNREESLTLLHKLKTIIMPFTEWSATLKRRSQNINLLFLATVTVPTALAIIYYGLIASNIYISESQIVVRTLKQNSATGSPMAAMLQGMSGGMMNGGSAGPESFNIQEYIKSRDALSELEKDLNIRGMFSNSSVDFARRFPGLFHWHNNFEYFYKYYDQILETTIDPLSSITTITIRAFSAQDAFTINEHLIELAERLVNKVNERAKHDLIGFATHEVNEAQHKAINAGLALSRYSNEKGIIDPQLQAGIHLQASAKLREELIAEQGQIQQLEKTAKANPQLPLLRKHVEWLQQQLHQEDSRVTSSGDKSLASKANEYQRLLLHKQFADNMLASAMTTLEQARIEAQRQQLYLGRIVSPRVPDVDIEPRRVRSIFTVFLAGLLVYATLSMLVAGMKEHSD